MLQSGMRAPMGIKVKGPDLDTIESFGLDLEREHRLAFALQGEAVQQRQLDAVGGLVDVGLAQEDHVVVGELPGDVFHRRLAVCVA